MLQTAISFAVELVQTFSVLEQVIKEHEAFLASLPKRSWDGDPTGLHHSSKEYFQYIPLDTSTFLRVMVPYLAKSNSFLDVGCGMGGMLRLVHHIAPSMRVGGIEFHKPYAEKAQEFAPDAQVINCDAFDYEDYNKWDVIYAYRPISRYQKMGKLEDLIVRKMRRGSTFVIFGPSLTTARTKRCLKERDDKRFGAYVYRKGTKG